MGHCCTGSCSTCVGSQPLPLHLPTVLQGAKEHRVFINRFEMIMTIMTCYRDIWLTTTLLELSKMELVLGMRPIGYRACVQCST